MGVFLFALLLFLIGVFLYRQGALTVNTAPPTISPSVTLDQPEYHVTLPNAWAHHAATGSLFDAEYSVPDKETVSVAVVDFTDASLADATVRDAHLAMASDMVAGWIGEHPALVARSRVKVGNKTLVVATYDITAASGVVTRVAEYVAIAPDRAVIVTAYGPQDAVGRHLGAVAAAASTAKVTLSAGTCIDSGTQWRNGRGRVLPRDLAHFGVGQAVESRRALACVSGHDESACG